MLRIWKALIKEAKFEAYIYLINSNGPAATTMESKGCVLADTDGRPIQLLGGVGNDQCGFPLADSQLPLPIFEADMVQVGKKNVFSVSVSGEDINSNSGTATANREAPRQRYQKAAIILWPSSNKNNIISSV